MKVGVPGATTEARAGTGQVIQCNLVNTGVTVGDFPCGLGKRCKWFLKREAWEGRRALTGP